MNSSFLDSSYWRRHGREDSMRPWLASMTDAAATTPLPAYDRTGQTKDQERPWVVGRHIFALAAAYLLYGEQQYLDLAKPAVQWLQDHAWDGEHGGWFDLLSPAGEPLDRNKTEFNWLYVDTGLAMYYLVTRDRATRQRLDESEALRERYWWDEVSGGYFRSLHPDLSPNETDKSFIGQVVPLSGPWLYLALASGDSKYRPWMRRSLDLAFTRLRDPESGWILERFDRDWRYLSERWPEDRAVNIGHNIEVAWTALRYGDLTGDTQFRAPALELVDRCLRYGYDSATGRWLHQVPRLHPENVPDTPHYRRTPWWVQQYGNYLALFAHHVTGEARYLEVFQRTAAFWDAHFVDHQHGGEFLNVAMHPNGTITGEKRPESAYHSMEHALLVSLYLDLFVAKQPATLHFRVQSPDSSTVYPVCPVESPDVKLTDVTVQGEPWEHFDPDARTIALPPGREVSFAVALASSSDARTRRM